MCIIVYAFLYIFILSTEIYLCKHLQRNYSIRLYQKRFKHAIYNDRDFIEIFNDDRRQSFACCTHEK